MQKKLRVVVHGGMHKTGTTSVQAWLSANRANLYRSGVFYPGFTEQHGFELNVKRDDWNPRRIRKMLRAGKDSGAEIIMFSGEVVSVLSSAQLATLATCFEDYDLTFVLVFRHWREYFPSRWAQYCQRRDTQSFGAYVRSALASDHLDHRFDLVLSAAEAAGASRTIAISYDNAVATDGSIVPAVLRATGCAFNAFPPTAMRIRNQNQRSDLRHTEILRLLNGIIANSYGLDQDNLYLTTGRHQLCASLFDGWRLVSGLSADISAGLYDAINRTATSILFDDRWRPPAAKLLEESFSHLFINKINDAIFPLRPATVAYSSIEWHQLPRLLQARVANHVEGWPMT